MGSPWAGPACEDRAAAAGWRRWLAPSFSDWLFIFLIVWLFVAPDAGWERLLRDGDTGWHIRTGETILHTRTAPRTDPFSFTKPGAPWYAWEWLSDVLFAAAFRGLGLKGVVLAAGVLIALFGTLLVRFALWLGANCLAALAFGLLGAGAASVHYLARPHVFTLVLVVVALWLLERDRLRPGPAVWWLVPATAAWANLHGGFLALPALLAVAAAGTALEGLTGARPRPEARRLALRYLLLLAGCGAASLANPYGWELHRHIAAYLRSDWIRDNIMEFQSPSFRAENVLQFEILLFSGLMAAAGLLQRGRAVEAGWILLWAHLSLASVRHIPIFVAVAAPVTAAEASRLWRRCARRAAAGSPARMLERIGADWGGGFRRTSVWPALAVLALAGSGASFKWPENFPASEFPVTLAGRHGPRIASARIFTDDGWADYLLFRFHPRQRVFFDGRSDFYGPEIGNQYIALRQGAPNWRELLDRHQIDLVLIPKDWPLASLLLAAPEWHRLDADERGALFARRDSISAPESGPENAADRLMKPLVPSEQRGGDSRPMRSVNRKPKGAAPPEAGNREPVAQGPEPGCAPSFWGLPSGEGLVELALHVGLLAPSVAEMQQEQREPLKSEPAAAGRRPRGGRR